MRSLLDVLRRSPSLPAPLTLDLGERSVTIALKRNARARRLTLRLARDGEGAVMTLPNRVSRAEALRFAERSQHWLRAQLANKPEPISLGDGATIMLRGKPYRLHLTGRLRGTVSVDDATGTIHLPGEAPHHERRLIAWLKSEAKRDLDHASRHYANAMGTTFAQLAVRDQKSRWGSCTSDGKLSYSWRLVMAPPDVLDYVAAHEVAHLKEMNHSPRFWRLVLTHCAATRKAKDWLKRHGRELHRLG
jgi:predicted metal-dependent hydrolase